MKANTIRLDKLLGNSGYGTRSEVRKFIKSGNVIVNGELVTDFSKHVDPECEVSLFNEKVEYKKFHYFQLNKPAGVISATYDPKEKTVINLLSERESNLGLFPVGRLDKDTEGLIFLTNNGKLAFELLSPKKHVRKLYYAEINSPVTQEDKLKIEEGIILDDGYKTLPGILKIIESSNNSKVEIQISEGKFHQIKRMFLALGKEVIFLKRLKVGNLNLDPSLRLGEYRELSKKELEDLVEPLEFKFPT